MIWRKARTRHWPSRRRTDRPLLSRQRADVHPHARSHRGADGHLLHVGAFRAGRLCPLDRISQRTCILNQLVVVEADLADPGVNDARLLRAEFHLAAFAAATAPFTSMVTVPRRGFGISPR